MAAPVSIPGEVFPAIMSVRWARSGTGLVGVCARRRGPGARRVRQQGARAGFSQTDTYNMLFDEELTLLLPLGGCEEALVELKSLFGVPAHLVDGRAVGILHEDLARSVDEGSLELGGRGRHNSRQAWCRGAPRARARVWRQIRRM